MVMPNASSQPTQFMHAVAYTPCTPFDHHHTSSATMMLTWTASIFNGFICMYSYLFSHLLRSFASTLFSQRPNYSISNKIVKTICPLGRQVAGVFACLKASRHVANVGGLTKATLRDVVSACCSYCWFLCAAERVFVVKIFWNFCSFLFYFAILPFWYAFIYMHFCSWWWATRRIGSVISVSVGFWQQLLIVDKCIRMPVVFHTKNCGNAIVLLCGGCCIFSYL